MEPPELNKEVSITLQAQEWNAVLDALSDGRYRIVAPLIQKIITQAQKAQDAPVPQLRPVS